MTARDAVRAREEARKPKIVTVNVTSQPVKTTVTVKAKDQPVAEPVGDAPDEAV